MCDVQSVSVRVCLDLDGLVLVKLRKVRKERRVRDYPHGNSSFYSVRHRETSRSLSYLVLFIFTPIFTYVILLNRVLLRHTRRFELGISFNPKILRNYNYKEKV